MNITAGYAIPYTQITKNAEVDNDGAYTIIMHCTLATANLPTHITVTGKPIMLAMLNRRK